MVHVENSDSVLFDGCIVVWSVKCDSLPVAMDACRSVHDLIHRYTLQAASLKWCCCPEEDQNTAEVCMIGNK